MLKIYLRFNWNTIWWFIRQEFFFIKSDIDLLQQFYWYVAPYVGVNQRFDFIQIGLNSILISMEQMLLYMSAKLRSRCNEMITIICNRNRILHIKDCDTEIQKELYTTIRQGLYLPVMTRIWQQ